MYNGHKNWNHWNVSLWIDNDEGLYNLAKECIRATRTLDAAATMFMGAIALGHSAKTPDGAPYTKTSVRAALRGLS